MRRLFFLILFLLICASPAFATDITIASFTINNYTRTTAKVRVYFSETFTDSTGVVIPSGSPTGGSVYKVVNCTVIGGTVTVPAFTIPSTRDGIDSTTSQVSFYLYDGNSQITPNPLNAYLGLSVPSSITSTTGCSPSGRCGSLAELKNINAGLAPIPPPQFYTAAQIDAILAATVGAGASVTLPFITRTLDASLTNEFALSTLATGLLKNTTGTGFPTIAVAGTDYLDPNGSGAGLTSLNATQLTSGTVPDARFPATLPAISGVNLTNLNASNLASGTIPNGRFPATLPVASGVNLTALNATQLTSGTIPIARGQEVWSVTDLTDYLTVSGTGTVALRTTISAPVLNQVISWDGSNWINAAPVAGFPDPMTTRGDLIFRNSSNVTARLPVGAANRYLSSDGTDASWGQVSLTAGVSGILPLANGGTGSASQNFVDLTTSQTVAGAKRFSTTIDPNIIASTAAALPTAGTAGRLYYQTDGPRGLTVDQGTQFYNLSFEEINVKAYGAKVDGKLVGDAAMIISTNHVTSGTAGFTSADVGKLIAVDGVGTAGATLSGTITVFNSASDVTVSFTAIVGASPTNAYYGTNDTTALGNALAAANPSGSTIRIPAGAMLLNGAGLTVGNGAGTISSVNGIRIIGAGGGKTQISFQSGATQIWWLGNASVPILTFAGPISGCGVEGIFFDCKVGPNAASSAIRTVWSHNGRFRNLSAIGHSGYAFDFDTAATPVAGAGVGGDDNLIEQIWAGAPSTTTGGGLRLGASDTTSAASSRNQVIGAELYSGTDAASAGLNLRFGDANTFYGVTTFAQGSGKGLLITATPSNSAYPSAVSFYNSSLSGGTSVSGAWGPGGKVNFWPYSVADGQAIPTDPGFVGVTTGTTAVSPTFFGLFTARDQWTYSDSIIIQGTNGLQMKPFGVGAGNTSETRWYELAANGSNYSGFKSNDNNGSSNSIYTMPPGYPASNMVLQSTSAGVLSWVAMSGGGIGSSQCAGGRGHLLQLR